MRKKNKGGRPSKIDKTVLAKLDDAFAFTYTDEEASLYAGIDPATLYRYQKKNPEFRKRKEQLRLSPNLAAKKVLVEGIAKNIDQSRWWAIHKMPEFTPVQKIEHKIEDSQVIKKMSPEMEEAVRLFRQAKLEQLKKEIDNMQD